MRIPIKKWGGALAVALCLVSGARAEPMAGDHIGVGIVLGFPTAGVSGKFPMDPTHSLNAMLGYDLYHGDAYARLDYVWHKYGLIEVPRGRLPLYYGPGAHLSAHGEVGLGVHGVVGLEYQLPDDPLDVFLEAAPGINLIPNTDPSISLGFGVRFFF